MSDVQSSNNLIAWAIFACVIIVSLPFWLVFVIVAAVLHKKGKVDMKLPTFAGFKSSVDNRHFDKWEAEELARVKKARTDFVEYKEVLMSEKELAEFEAFKRNKRG